MGYLMEGLIFGGAGAGIVLLAWLVAGRRAGRGGLVSRPAMLDGAMEQRLQRIEQAVDAIAIEVERVSEGQRFTTRLLVERDRVRDEAAGAGSSRPGATP